MELLKQLSDNLIKRADTRYLRYMYHQIPWKNRMKALNGTEYKGRTVRCNDADEEGHGKSARGDRSSEGKALRGGRSAEARGGKKPRRQEDTGDWRQFFQHNDKVKLKGEEPDFAEEGWARRRPKKK